MNQDALLRIAQRLARAIVRNYRDMQPLSESEYRLAKQIADLELSCKGEHHEPTYTRTSCKG